MDKYNVLDSNGVIVTIVMGELIANITTGGYPYEIYDDNEKLVAVIPAGFIIIKED